MKAKWINGIGLSVLALIQIPFMITSPFNAGIFGACLASALWGWLFWDTSEMLDRSHQRELDLHTMLRNDK